jgi:hypothetical protein
VKAGPGIKSADELSLRLETSSIISVRKSRNNSKKFYFAGADDAS